MQRHQNKKVYAKHFVMRSKPLDKIMYHTFLFLYFLFLYTKVNMVHGHRPNLFLNDAKLYS